MAIVALQTTPKQRVAEAGLTWSFDLAAVPPAGSTVLIPLINYNASSGGVSSVSIGGQAAVRDALSSPNNSQVSWWRVSNFTGSGVAVVVTHGNGDGNYTTGAAVVATGLRLVPVDRTALPTGSGTANVVLAGAALTNAPQLVCAAFNFLIGNSNHGLALLGDATALFIENDSSTYQGGGAAFQIVDTTAAPSIAFSRSVSAAWEGALVTYMAEEEPSPPPEPSDRHIEVIEPDNSRNFRRAVSASAGSADAGAVVLLNAQGEVDPSMRGGAASGGHATRALQLLRTAASTINRNCRTRGLHPSPPTVSVLDTSAPSGYTRQYDFNVASSPFAHSGGTPATASGLTSFLCVTPSVAQTDFFWRVETIVDTAGVAFWLDSATADGYRFQVEDQYLSLAGTSSAAGSQRYYQLAFADARERRVAVEGRAGLRFGHARVIESGRCILPADVGGPRMVYMGDSDAFITGYTLKGDSLAVVLADCLGIRDVRVSAINSTGFLANGGGHNYAGRRSDWSALDRVDLLWFQMSYNDYAGGFTAQQVGDAVAAEIAAALLAHPNALVIIQGPSSWNDTAGSIAAYQAHEAAAAAAVAASGHPGAWFIPIYSSAQEKPITGTSAPGDTGTGNTSVYVWHELDHMTPVGNAYHGRCQARLAYQALAGIAGVSPPMAIHP